MSKSRSLVLRYLVGTLVPTAGAFAGLYINTGKLDKAAVGAGLIFAAGQVVLLLVWLVAGLFRKPAGEDTSDEVW